MISIIIPVFNDADYISKCLDSIIDQEGNLDFEIVIVNDGSTDATPDIIQQYCEEYENIKVINQENSGSGSARNNGIINSKGDFICFVDADDWLEPTTLTTLYYLQKEKDYDWVLGSSCINFFEKKHVKKIEERNSDKSYLCVDDISKCYFDLFINGRSHGPWGKLYKRSVIVENGITFPNVRRSQDIFFNNEYAKYIKSMKTTSAIVYNFRSEVQGRTNKNQSRRNAGFMIEAEKIRFKIVNNIFNSFLECMQFRGFVLNEQMKRALSNRYVIEIHDAIEAVTVRQLLSTKEYIGSIMNEKEWEPYFQNSRPEFLYYSFFRKKFMNKELLLVNILIHAKVQFGKHFRFIFRFLKRMKSNERN